MPLFLAKHGLFFGDYAAAYATFRWLCFRLCSIFRGHICPKKAIMLLHMLLFGAYAIYYALILGSNIYALKRRLCYYLFFGKAWAFFCDYAAAYATFRWLCFRLCSIFRGHSCMVVSGLFTLVFGRNIVFFIYLTSSQSVLCC